jgi:magnesium chelatase subunit D
MSHAIFPFAAIVGQPQLKLALLLASVDWRLSVLLKGDKGSGKSTAARALAGILPGGAPFVNLPIGTTEDRLLGGLDLARAFEGEAALKHGLIHEAHGGVLYIDEVNLLADALTDALLDVASAGRHYVERDGLSASAESRFVLLGSMNIEEGALRPQLLDRFALALDVEAPLATEERVAISEARLQFDADPAAFCAAFDQEQMRLRESVSSARLLAAASAPNAEALAQIASAVTAAGVRSLRADLAALRAAIAHAALEGRTEIQPEDIDAVMPLVLHHRVKRGAPHQEPRMAYQRPQEQSPQERPEQSAGAQDRVFPSEPWQAPNLRIRADESRVHGRTAELTQRAASPSGTRGKPAQNGALDLVASFRESFRTTGDASLHPDHLAFREPRSHSGTRFIFLVDSSGSHAARERMRAVKGAAAALLESSVDQKDEVAVISFRGPKAEIVLEPCRDVEAAQRSLEFLPTGGRTPLAHALDLAQSLVNPASLLVLLTDGRANVPLAGGDAWADALDAARRLKCASVVIDSSIDSSSGDALRTLASALEGRWIRLDDLSRETLINVLKPI